MNIPAIGLLPRPRQRCASGGGRRRGVGRAHPEGQTPQLGAAGRDNHQDTKTQTSSFLWTLAEPCAPTGPLRSYLRRVRSSDLLFRDNSLDWLVYDHSRESRVVQFFSFLLSYLPFLYLHFNLLPTYFLSYFLFVCFFFLSAILSRIVNHPTVQFIYINLKEILDARHRKSMQESQQNQ